MRKLRILIAITLVGVVAGIGWSWPERKPIGVILCVSAENATGHHVSPGKRHGSRAFLDRDEGSLYCWTCQLQWCCWPCWAKLDQSHSN